ncbi:TrbC/VirB2 family protein [Variovorax saccharolyticus]|uniref:TrbC/VirB2 family protein n=1 Tax=Variovorax saccharolyticus TaxID=3053516 RepID=UPI0025760B8A|nr:TrbC/VirB2 family protein [Variovorax sp. J31P216]MDM0030427.1 TrbC/VirB2 family protein [Variovorax sp. J31P216]
MDVDGNTRAPHLPQPEHAGHAPEDPGHRQHAGASRTADLDRRASGPSALAASSLWLVWATVAALTPGLALAGSPFATGASATQSQLVAILTPLAAVAVMVSGVMAWFGRISWFWMVGVVLGTVLVFGGPQIVSWIRGMFGV